MSHALTPAPSDPSTTPVVVPDSGDPRTALSVDTPFQSLVNGLLWIRGVLVGNIASFVTLIAGAQIFDGLSITGGLTADVLTLSGAAALAGPVTFSGSGRVTPRWVSVAGTAGMVASVGTATDYFYPTAAASSVVQISDTGAQNGDTLHFSCFEATNSVTVKNPAGGTLIVLTYSGIGSSYYSADVVRIAGTWTVVRVGSNR